MVPSSDSAKLLALGRAAAMEDLEIFTRPTMETVRMSQSGGDYMVDRASYLVQNNVDLGAVLPTATPMELFRAVGKCH